MSQVKSTESFTQVVYLKDGLRKYQWRSGKKRPRRKKGNKVCSTKQVTTMGNYSLVLEESAQNLLPPRAISPEGQGSWGVSYTNPHKSLFERYELVPRHFWPATHVGRAGSSGQRKPAGKRFRQLEGLACTETEGAKGTHPLRLWGCLLYCQVQYFYLLFALQLNEEDSKASEEGRTTGACLLTRSPRGLLTGQEHPIGLYISKK